MMRFCVLHIALIVIMHFQNGRIWGSADMSTPVCNTTECQRLGKFYLQNIDNLADPCNDFYDYVCSNWAVHNPRPKDLSIQNLWNVDHSLEARSLQEMRKLLESTVPSNTSEFAQAKLLYKTCMFTPYLGRSRPSDVWNIMKKIASPNLFSTEAILPERPSIWEIEEFYIQTAGESALFDFYPLYDATTNEIITNLQYPLSPYGSLVRPVGWTSSNERTNYKAFLFNIIQSIVQPGINISKEAIDKDIDAVIEFRDHLNTIIAKCASNDTRQIMAIHKFQLLYFLTKKSNPDLNWVNVISAMYKNSNDPHKFNITKLSTVRVHVSYFLELTALLGRTSKRTIAYHIHLYFAENHVEWTSQMKSQLVGSVAESEIKATVMSDKARWKKCIETNNLRTAIGKAYVSSFFPPAQKPKKYKNSQQITNLERVYEQLEKTDDKCMLASELFETMKKLMGMQIVQSTWLNKQTKEMSINKLIDMKGSLGYPDWYDATAPTKLASPQMDPILPLIFYIRGLNQIISSAAALQWPVYSPNLPYVIDYGSLGTRFGYELYRAFDAEGVKTDAKGNSPWWPSNMVTRYLMNTLCFINSYKKYKQQEVIDLTANTSSTTRNDVANAMGLKLAYIGFKEMLKKKNGVCPVLPGFKGEGCEKLFFIAFASNHCSAPLPGYNELVWFRNGQNIPKVKINGAVATLKEFGEAFSCKNKALLYTSQSCDIWRP